jgi:hypothetical protein
VNVDLEAARVLLAGFIAGLAGGLLSLPIVLMALVRSRRWQQRQRESGLSFAAVGILAANAMLLAWTLAGLILGAVYLGASQPAFSISIVAALAALAAAAAFVTRRVAWPVWSTALVAAAAFAGLLPLLASAR